MGLFAAVCDPVLGDNGKLYVPEDLVQVYRDFALPHASLLTPNQFELELLTQRTVATEQDAQAACAQLHEQGVPTVVRPMSLRCDAADSNSCVHNLCMRSAPAM